MNKNILEKGMKKSQVNKLSENYLLLEDDIYLGNKHKHNWKCKCGNVFIKTYGSIQQRRSFDCGCVNYKKQEERYKYEVEKDGEYEYIRSYRKGDMLPNGKVARVVMLNIKHLYCGNIYEIECTQFINKHARCAKCCGSYENSFAHYIEVELDELLEKYWDFEKNTVNPHHISKCSHKKVWIKCQNEEVNELNGLKKRDYHNSYTTTCDKFVHGRRCWKCTHSGYIKEVHPYDSFGYYLEKNNMLHLLSEKNNLNVYKISKCCGKKVYMKCDKKDYHNDKGGYIISCDNFYKGVRCGYCSSKKVHKKDSFGYKYPYLTKYWIDDRDIYSVPKASSKKYKFKCENCGKEFYRSAVSKSRNIKECRCSECNSSIGERIIKDYLKINDINYEYEKTFENLIGLGGKNLSYDFYLPDYNLLIEYQGEQHEIFIKGMQKIYEKFEKQQEHDRRKREYAIKHDIKLLEIWYYDFDNIEEILNNFLKK